MVRASVDNRSDVGRGTPVQHHAEDDVSGSIASPHVAWIIEQKG